MGGDFGPSVAVPAALQVAARHSHVRLLLIGDEQRINPFLQSIDPQQGARIEVLHTPDALSNLIRPEKALRGHRSSSLYLAVEQVQLKQADACVSAGNTGALMLISRYLLKDIPGILRPAMLAGIPVAGARSKGYLLDVGAHVNSSAEELFQFAMMGAVLAAAELQARPRVGLLNIGAEEHKGTDIIRRVGRALEKQEDLDYIGFIEANRIYSGDADVIVCDGFTGNVTIKNSAGVVQLIEAQLAQIIAGSLPYRMLGSLAAPLLRKLQQAIDPARFNGASILGLQGIVVKSHGNASIPGFVAALEQAEREISAGVQELIAAHATTLELMDLQEQL